MSNDSIPGRRRRKRVVLPVVIVVGVTVVVVGFSTLLFGFVRGDEFSPDSFERRRYWYYEIPLVKIQVWPIRRRPLPPSPLAADLRRLGVLPANATDPQWDLVSVSSLGDRQEGDAAILLPYLEGRRSSAEYWQEWTRNNQPRAMVLWPEVVRLAQKQLYVFIPDIMELARTAANAVELQSQINSLLADRYYQLGRIQQIQGEHALAVRLLDEALRYEPGHTEALRTRDRSREAIGPAASPANDGEAGDVHAS